MLRGEAAPKKSAFAVLQRALFRRARRLKLLPKKSEGVIDATGLETRHVSRYYVDRKGFRRFRRRRWPKLTVVAESKTHLIAGAHVSWGPSQDSPQFRPAVRQSAACLDWDRLMGDTAYDAEHNHVLCRRRLGIRSTVIPINQRRSRKWPKTKYRRQMKKRFFTRVYGNRWQVESVISRNKRLLGAALRARKTRPQKRECLLRVLTHNVMILAAA